MDIAEKEGGVDDQAVEEEEFEHDPAFGVEDVQVLAVLGWVQQDEELLVQYRSNVKEHLYDFEEFDYEVIFIARRNMLKQL